MLISLPTLVSATPAATASVGYNNFGQFYTELRFDTSFPVYIAVDLNLGELTTFDNLSITTPVAPPITFDAGTGARLFQNFLDVTALFGSVQVTATGVSYVFNPGISLENESFSFSVPVSQIAPISGTGLAISPTIDFSITGVPTTLTLNPITLLSEITTLPTYQSGLQLLPTDTPQRALVLPTLPSVFFNVVISTFTVDTPGGLSPSFFFNICGNMGNVLFDVTEPIAVFLDGQDVTSQGTFTLDVQAHTGAFTFIAPQNLAGRTLVARAKFVAFNTIDSNNIELISNEYFIDGIFVGAGFFPIYGPGSVIDNKFLTKLLRLTPMSPATSVLVVPSNDVDVIVDLTIQTYNDGLRIYHLNDTVPFPYDAVAMNGIPVVQVLLNGVTPIPNPTLEASYNPTNGLVSIDFTPTASLLGQLITFRFTLQRNTAAVLPANGVLNVAGLQIENPLITPSIDIGRLVRIASLPFSAETADIMRQLIGNGKGGGLPYAESDALILPPGSIGLPNDCICPPTRCVACCKPGCNAGCRNHSCNCNCNTPQPCNPRRC